MSQETAGSGSTMRWLVSGAIAGAISAVGLTMARWGTWEPYSPLLIPYDVALFTAAGIGGFALSAILVQPRWGPVVAKGVSTGSLLALLTAIWGINLGGTGGGTVLKLLSVTVFVAAAVIFLVDIFARRERGWPIGWFFLAVTLSLSFSVVGYQAWKFSALVFPLATVAALSAGFPRVSPGWSRHDGAPLTAALAITIFCSSTVFPWSGQLVDTSSRVPPRAAPAPSFILIVLDTLRQDHLSLHGYERPTTPNIDEWARDALIFDDASAASSWTLPSHASMFTGLFPRTHGAHAFRGASPVNNAYALAEGKVTLAEIASQEGYATAALVANNVYLRRRYGLDQGFDTYWLPVPRAGVRFAPSEILAEYFSPWLYQEFRWQYYRDRYMTDNAVRWLEASRGRPFFLFLNYMDVHTPNARPPLSEVPLDDESPFTAHRYDFANVMDGTEEIAPAVLRDLVNSYDRELIHLDRELGRLLDYLEQSGLDATTNVMITSDHGEYFGEHDLFLHGKHLHEEVVRVPLILKGPDVRPGRTSRPVQGVDVFRTALDLMRISYTGEAQGTSLLQGEPRPVVAEYYASTTQELLSPRYRGRFDRDLRTIRMSRHKLFLDEHDRIELYDLQADPRESEDLADRLPDIVTELRARLANWLLEHPAADTEPNAGASELTPEEIARLRALGYIR